MFIAAVPVAATLGDNGEQPTQTAPALTARAEMTRDGVVVRYPTGWSISQTPDTVRIVNLPQDRLAAADPQTLANATQVSIHIERVRNHAEALRLLQGIRGESTAPTTFLTIGGWPALQRRAVEARPQPGNEIEDDALEQERGGPAQQKQMLTPANMLMLTTAVAAGDLLVRADGSALPDVRGAEDAIVQAIGRSLTFRTTGNAGAVSRELDQLRRAPVPRPRAVPRPGAIAAAGPAVRSAPAAARRAGVRRGVSGASPLKLASAGAALAVSGGSESEIAVSTNGQNIIIAQGFNYARSTNGGLSFSAGVGFAGTNGGDGSIAFGRSGTFYAATIGAPSSRVFASTDNGATFPFRANAYTCPSTGPNQCGFTFGPPANTPFPDQEHIAADRFNASAGGGDQVYVVWRNAGNRYGLVCSNDSGQNWTATASAVLRTGDFPRITVGQDGRVYVVYRSGNNVNLDRFDSCTNGLTLQVNAATIATLGPSNWVACPVPGLDRCNNGNNLSSFMVAVDDTDANHVYVSYAQNTSATNESVLVQDSTDGGATWPAARTVTISSAVNARRFMPWVCSAGGVAYVNWFDRRAASAPAISLTDFFASSATRDGAGNLIAGLERRVNAANAPDNQCEAGAAPGSAASWPGSTRATPDSETCTPQQPQLAGRCFVPGSSPPTGSGQACDFSTPNCPTLPTAETCQTGSGVPKYGDYNGNACAAGRFYSIWPSSTPPPPGAPTPIRMYFASLVVAGAQIQSPGPVIVPDTCVGTSSLAVVNVCNTGKTDLHVDPITSSDPQFAVTTPSSGFPVTIGPASCFPFEVRFTPSSPGPKSATLSVPSDDTVTPTVAIPVSSNGGQGALTTIIADTGNFGTACQGGFRDLPLMLTNPGTCPVTVTGIASSAADFIAPQVLSFPITVAPGATTEVPLRFHPASPGAKSATITVTSTAPTTPSLVRVSGTGGQPVIATIVADTGSFGKVCSGETRDKMLTISNSGTCPLVVSAIASSSPEFQMPQVLSYPVTIAAGMSLQVPIRFAPTTPGAKTANITISSNDPATPSKIVSLTGETPEEWICHPPTFASVGMSGGPAFGHSRTSDFTFSGAGRSLVPFGKTHSFGVQTQGEFIGYHERYEGEVDAGLLNRWKWIQGGLFANVKAAGLGPLSDAGTLAHASFTLDVLLKKFRFNVFGARGFHDAALVRVVDQFGGGAQVSLAPFAPKTWLEGNLIYLHLPEPLPARPGAMIRVSHQLFDHLELMAEVTVNESLVGPTNNGRVVVGFVFGRWARPADLTNKGTPLGTDVPRVHYVIR